MSNGLFDDDLKNIMNSVNHVGVERKIRALPEIIFALGIEQFKADESESNAPAKPHNSMREVAQIRKSLKKKM